ncbi:MAG: transcription elongation factor GreAB [Verrucomicrobiota bacterium]
MDKKKIHQQFIARLQEDVDGITDAAKKSFAMATDNEHKAESKYDTFSLEASYLARGQAQRVEELKASLERFEVLPLKEFEAGDPILLSALVHLAADDGDDRYLFFGPSSGGLEIETEGKTVMVVTKQSPLGQAILGKCEGESFEIKMGPFPESFKIVSVS